jgi:MFS family permease
VALFYTYLALASSRATSGIWILFLLGRGLPLWEIGLLESAFHVTVLVAEVPTGYFADRVGHRLSLALGAVCGVVSNLMFLVVSTPGGYLAAFILSALSWVLPSGADRALLYAMTRNPEEYPRRAAQASGVRSLASAAGIFAGGALAAIGGLGLPYYGEAAALVFALFATLWMREPERSEKLHEDHVPWRDILPAARGMWAPILAGSFTFAAMNLASLLLQPLLAARGAAASLVAWARGTSDLALAGGSFAATRVRGSQARKRLVRLLPLSLAAVYGVLGTVSLWPAAGLQQIESAAGGAYEAVLDAEQTPLFPERLRATLLSLQSALQSALVAALFPLLGWLSQAAGWGVVFLAAGSLAAAGAVLWRSGGLR